MKREKSGNQNYLEALPYPSSGFLADDPARLDIYGQLMTDVHIRIKRNDEGQVRFYCYCTVAGAVSGADTCFGAAETLEEACNIIAGLTPLCV